MVLLLQQVVTIQFKLVTEAAGVNQPADIHASQELLVAVAIAAVV